MAERFPPGRESDLLALSANFLAKGTANPTDFGLTMAQMTAYALLHDDFAAKYQVANDPTTRTKVAIESKNIAKAELVKELRVLAQVVQNTPGMDNARRAELELPLRKEEPTSHDAPDYAPGLQLVSVVGRTVTGRLWDTLEPERRGRPEFTAGALVWSYVGEQPPANIRAWTLVGAIGRTSFKATFPDTVPAGSKVWLTAAWMSDRKTTGPACDPVPTYVGGGIAGQAA